ncbi:MAG: dephospho-CoA kinase [Fretibacterium sp.]|nr:dephospho-CoA kinase [Fretibacterium sp.]
MAAVTAVGVTGDVGAGKSTVARLMEKLGGVRLDADAVALALWERPDIRTAAVARWGADILDPSGAIDRRAVAGRIFSDPAEHRWCCGLLHPLVMAELKRRVDGLSASQWAVVEIPLLFESGRPDWLDLVVFVTAPRDVRAERCRVQRGWDEAELRRREEFFLPSAERMARSDYVVNNAEDRAALEAEVGRIVESMSDYNVKIKA